MNTRLCIAGALLFLFCQATAHADSYGSGEVSLSISDVDCLNGTVNWKVHWGNFPPLRSPYQRYAFGLLSRNAVGATHSVVAPSQYPGSLIAGTQASLQPNTCLYVGFIGKYYRVQVFAWQWPYTPGTSLTEATFVSPEVRSIWKQCKGQID
jgi:hypothetical protein